jgi:hypothetical protein
MPAGLARSDRMDGHPAHRASTALIRRAPRAGGVADPDSTTPAAPPDTSGPACAGHVMDNPICSMPACQVRPVRAHQRRNNAIKHA